MSELEKQELVLELGQVVKFIAPSNTELHNKNLFIEYLDETKIKLLDIEKDTPIILGINMGVLNDESIESIVILYTLIWAPISWLWFKYLPNINLEKLLKWRYRKS